MWSKKRFFSLFLQCVAFYHSNSGPALKMYICSYTAHYKFFSPRNQLQHLQKPNSNYVHSYCINSSSGKTSKCIHKNNSFQLPRYFLFPYIPTLTLQKVANMILKADDFRAQSFTSLMADLHQYSMKQKTQK